MSIISAKLTFNSSRDKFCKPQSEVGTPDNCRCRNPDNLEVWLIWDEIQFSSGKCKNVEMKMHAIKRQKLNCKFVTKLHHRRRANL